MADPKHLTGFPKGKQSLEALGVTPRALVYIVPQGLLPQPALDGNLAEVTALGFGGDARLFDGA